MVSQLKAGALLSYAALGLGTLVTFVYTPFMLRALGQAEYGLFSLVSTTIAYLTILDFGFGNAIVRYTAKYRAQNDHAKEEQLHGMLFVLYLAIGVIAFLIAVALIFNIDHLLSDSFSESERATVRVLMWLAAANVAMTFPFSVFAASILAYERFIFTKSMDVLQLVATPIVMAVVLLMGYRSIGMVAAATVLNLSLNIWKYLYWRRTLGLRLRFRGFDVSLLKEIAAYSFFVFLNLIVDRIYWSSGQVLLGIFANSVSVSVFAIGMQLVTRFYIQLSTALTGVFLPKVTAVAVRSEDSTELSILFVRVARLQFIVLTLVLCGFILYGSSFIRQWAGEEYAESYYVALIVMLPLTVPLTQNLGISILQAKKMHAFRSVAYVFIAFANIAISIPLVKLWGPVGCAIGTAFSLVVGQILLMNFYYHHKVGIDIKRFWVEIARMLPAVVLPSVLGLAFLRLVPAETPGGLIVNAVFFTCAYAVCMLSFGMNANEKALLVSPMQRVLRRVGLARG